MVLMMMIAVASEAGLTPSDDALSLGCRAPKSRSHRTVIMDGERAERE